MGTKPKQNLYTELLQVRKNSFINTKQWLSNHAETLFDPCKDTGKYTTKLLLYFNMK